MVAEVIDVRVGAALSRKQVDRSVFAADIDERLGLITCERALFGPDFANSHEQIATSAATMSSEPFAT